MNFLQTIHASNTGFQKDFKGRFTAPRIATSKNSDLTIVVDASSIELFADGGTAVMTAIYFPNEILKTLQIKSNRQILLNVITIMPLKSIWEYAGRKTEN